MKKYIQNIVHISVSQQYEKWIPQYIVHWCFYATFQVDIPQLTPTWKMKYLCYYNQHNYIYK